jgi:hypothetical protein
MQNPDARRALVIQAAKGRLIASAVRISSLALKSSFDVSAPVESIGPRQKIRDCLSGMKAAKIGL